MYKTSALEARKIISLALSLLLIIPSITSAAPFDIFDKYYPDYLISNIWQDNSSKDIYVKICNVWWSMDGFWTMLIWFKKSNWSKYWKIFQNVNIYNWGCVDYRVFTPSEIWIGSSGNYDLAVWVIIKSNKTERNKYNNVSRRNLYITTQTTFYNNQNYNYYNQNYYYNDYNSYYNRNIDITYPAGWETFSNNSSNYINLRAKVYANSRDISYVNIYFIRQNNWEQYKYERIDNINYTYGTNNPFDINKTFYINNWPAWDYYVKMAAYDNYGNIVATDITRSFTINNYYNDNYNYNYNYNYSNPDLVVREVWQDTYNNRIYAKICNIWGNMSSSLNLRFDFLLNGKTVEKYFSVNLNRDACTTDLYVNTTDFMQWYYYDNSVSVRIDVNNNLQESNENNNYYSQNINTSWLRSDLVVDNITQNRNSRTLTIKICNRWNSTLNNQNWSTRIYNNSNSTTIIKNHSTNLSQNACIDFDVSYYEIWIAYNNYWYYEIKVETDIYNNIYESNEDNNSYIRSFNY